MSDPSYSPSSISGSSASTNSEYASRRFAMLQEQAPELGFDSMWSLANSGVPDNDLIDQGYKTVNILQLQQGINTLKTETKERQKALWSRFNSARKQLYTDNGYEPPSDNTNWFMGSLGKVGGALGWAASNTLGRVYNQTIVGAPFRAAVWGGLKAAEAMTWVQDKSMFLPFRAVVDKSGQMTKARLDTALNQTRSELEAQGYKFNDQQWNHFKWQYAEKNFGGTWQTGSDKRDPGAAALLNAAPGGLGIMAQSTGLFLGATKGILGNIPGIKQANDFAGSSFDDNNPYEKLQRDSTGITSSAFEAFENTAQRLMKTEAYEISSWASLKRTYDGGDYQNPMVAVKAQNDLRDAGFKGGAYDLASFLSRDKTLEDWLQEVEKLAPDAEEYEQRFKDLSTYMANKNFTETMGDLRAGSSKLSLGRSLADSFGLEKDSAPYTLVSGAGDFAATLFLDPFIVAGKAAKGITFLKKAVAFADLPQLRHISKAVKAGQVSNATRATRKASQRGERASELIDDAVASYREGINSVPYLSDDVAIKQFDDAARRLDDTLVGRNITSTAGVVIPGRNRITTELQTLWVNTVKGRGSTFADRRARWFSPFHFIDDQGKIANIANSNLDEVGKFLNEAEKFLVGYGTSSKAAIESLEDIAVLKRHLQRMPTGALNNTSAFSFVDSARVRQVTKWNNWIDTVIAGFKEINLEDASEVSNAAVRLMNSLPYGRTIMSDLTAYNSKLMREGGEGLTSYDAVWDFIEHEYFHFAAGRGTGTATRGFANRNIVTPKWRIFRTGLDDVNRLNRPLITGVDIAKSSMPNYVRLPEITAPGKYVRKFANASEDAIDAIKRLKDVNTPVRIASKPLRVAASLTWNLSHHVPRSKAIDLSKPESVAEFERFVNQGFAAGMSKKERDGLVDLYLRGITDNGTAWAQYAGNVDDLEKATTRLANELIEVGKYLDDFDPENVKLFGDRVEFNEISKLFDNLKNGKITGDDEIDWAHNFVRQMHNDVDEFLDEGFKLSTFEQAVWDEIKKVAFINPKTNSLGARVYLMRQVMEDIFTRLGIASDDESAKVVQRFLNGLAHMQYAPGNYDVVGLGSAAKKVALLPVAQFSTDIALPSTRELWAKAANVSRLSKVTRRTFNSAFVEAVMGSMWKPITLLRLAFVPRAAGEEYFAFYAREGIWAPLTSMATYAGSDTRGLLGRIPASFSAWTAKHWGELGKAGLSSDAWNVTNMLAHKNVNDYITESAEWVSKVSGRELNKFDYFAIMSNYWTARTLKSVRGFYFKALPEELKRAILLRNKELGKVGFNKNMGYNELYDAHVGIENASAAFMREPFFQRVIADDTASMGRNVVEVPYDDIPTTQTVNIRLNGFNPDSGVTLKMRAGHEWVEFNPAKMDESSLQKMAYWYGLLALDPTLRGAFDAMAGTITETKLLDQLGPALERTAWEPKRVVVNADEVAASEEAQRLVDAEYNRLFNEFNEAYPTSSEFEPQLADRTVSMSQVDDVYDPSDLTRVPSERTAMNEPDVIDRVVQTFNNSGTPNSNHVRDLIGEAMDTLEGEYPDNFKVTYNPDNIDSTLQFNGPEFDDYMYRWVENARAKQAASDSVNDQARNLTNAALEEFNRLRLFDRMSQTTPLEGFERILTEEEYTVFRQKLFVAMRDDPRISGYPLADIFIGDYTRGTLSVAPSLDVRALQDYFDPAFLKQLVKDSGLEWEDELFLSQLSETLSKENLVFTDIEYTGLAALSEDELVDVAASLGRQIQTQHRDALIRTIRNDISNIIARGDDYVSAELLQRVNLAVQNGLRSGTFVYDEFDDFVSQITNVDDLYDGDVNSILNNLFRGDEQNTAQAISVNTESLDAFTWNEWLQYDGFEDDASRAAMDRANFAEYSGRPVYETASEEASSRLQAQITASKFLNAPPDLYEFFADVLDVVKQFPDDAAGAREVLKGKLLKIYSDHKESTTATITDLVDKINWSVKTKVDIPEELLGSLERVDPSVIVLRDDLQQFRVPDKFIFKSLKFQDQWYVDDAGFLHIRTNRWGRNGDNSVSSTSNLDFALDWPDSDADQAVMAIIDKDAIKDLIRGTGAYADEVEIIARSLDGGELIVDPGKFKLFDQSRVTRYTPVPTRQTVVADLRRISNGLPPADSVFWRDETLGLDGRAYRDEVINRGYADIPLKPNVLVERATNFNIENVIARAEELRLYIQGLSENDRNLVHRYLQARDVAGLDSPVDERLVELPFDFDKAPDHVQQLLLKSPEGSAFPELIVRAVEQQQLGDPKFMQMVEAISRMDRRMGQLLASDQPIRILDRAAQREVLISAVRSGIMDPRYKTWVDGNQRLIIGSRSGSFVERMPDANTQNIYAPMVSSEFAQTIIDLKRNVVQVQNVTLSQNAHENFFKELEGFYNSLRADGMTSDEEQMLRSFMDQIDTDSLEKILAERVDTRSGVMVPLSTTGFTNYDDAARIAEFLGTWRPSIGQMRPDLDFARGTLRDPELVPSRTVRLGKMNVEKNNPNLIASNPAMPNLLTVQLDNVLNGFEAMPRTIQRRNSQGLLDPLGEIVQETGSYETNIDEWAEVLVSALEESLYSQKGDVMHELIEPIRRGTFGVDAMGTVAPSDLPQKLFAPVNYAVPENILDQVVQFGFGKIINPAIFAIVRNPMYTLAFSRGYEAARYQNVYMRNVGLDDAMEFFMTKKNLDPNEVRNVWEMIPYQTRKQLSSSVDFDAELAGLIDAGKLNPNSLLASTEISSEDLQTIMAWARMDSHIERVNVQVAAERAMADVIPYIDDHSVRSFFQEYARNIFPFEFAQEAFLKRWARTVFYSPEAFRRAQLVAHAFTNNGLIHEDAYGNKYLILPGTETMNALLEDTGLGKLMFGEDVALPTKIPFGMNTSRVLPGIPSDLEHLPAFSPFAMLGLKPAVEWFPEIKPFVSVFQGGMPIDETQNVAKMFVPRNYQRLWTSIISGYGESALGLPGELQRHRIAAMQQMEAEAGRLRAEQFDLLNAGQEDEASKLQDQIDRLSLPDKASVRERQRWLDENAAWARSNMLIRGVLGFIVPSTPQNIYEYEHLSDEFTALLDVMDFDEAIGVFLAEHPEGGPFTIFDTGKTSKAPLTRTEESRVWLNKNEDWLNKFPLAGYWLMPMPNEDSEFAPQVFFDMLGAGYRFGKTGEQWYDDFKFAAGASVYFPEKTRYDLAIEAAPNDKEKSFLRKEWEAKASSIKLANPLFAELLEDRVTSEAERTIKEIDLMLALPNSDLPDAEHLDVLRVAVDSWRNYKQNYDSIGSSNTKVNREKRDTLRKEFIYFGFGFINQNPEMAGFWNSIILPALDLTSKSAVLEKIGVN